MYYIYIIYIHIRWIKGNILKVTFCLIHFKYLDKRIRNMVLVNQIIVD